MTPPRRIAGVGAGPANLSLAALADPLPDAAVALFDRRESLRWHPGLGFPGAELQVTFLKDLVTPVDPTSRHSFLAFLKDHDRLYRALVANRTAVSRAEFEGYLRWVAGRLPDIRFGRPVEAVEAADDGLRVGVAGQGAVFDDVVIGVGQAPAWPAVPGIEAAAVHSADFLPRPDEAVADRTVAVVGGGQSGAEVVAWLLDRPRPPALIHWITRRPNLLPMDDSPFVNEQFFPPYRDHFFRSDADVRDWLNAAFKLTSDGISEATLQRIYRRLYDIECVAGGPRAVEIRVATALTGVAVAGDRRVLTVADTIAGGEPEALACDLLVCATGYRFVLPACLEPLRHRLTLGADGLPEADDHYAVAWDGAPRHRIYLQNAGRGRYGLADPNLSLLAYRSARILNHATGRAAYRLGEESGAIRWPGPRPARAAMRRSA